MSTWIWVVIVTIVVATTLIGLSKLSSSRNWSKTTSKLQGTLTLIIREEGASTVLFEDDNIWFSFILWFGE
jgi:hypothetical protein